VIQQHVGRYVRNADSVVWDFCLVRQHGRAATSSANGKNYLQVLGITIILNVLIKYSCFAIKIILSLSNFYKFKNVPVLLFTSTLSTTPQSAVNQQ
jgi:hypothetical protein